MSAADAPPDEDRFASLLAACDDALAAGGPPPVLAGTDTPPELRRRVEEQLSCLHLLRRLLPGGPETAPDAAFWGLDLGSLPVWLGRFRIRGELGRGGFGIVLLADDPLLGRQVALKVPRAGALMSADLRERFLREAKAAARLEHPNLAPVYEAGAVGPVCYIVSAYCPGPDLAAWLKQRPEPPDPRTAAALTAALADGLAHAHAHGVLHRDVKPSNVLLMPRADAAADGLDFTPRLTDFGLAKVLEDEGPPTTSGVLLGTAPYMAPEQAEGRQAAVGPATDVYGLGAILYEMLAGRPPLQGATLLATLEQVRSEEPAPPGRFRGGLPPDLETICLKSLRKRPGDRYASAGDLAADLRRFLAGDAIRARRVGWAGRLLDWCRSPDRIRDAGVVAVIATVFDLLASVLPLLLAAAGQLPQIYNYFHASAYFLTLLFGVALPMIWITRRTLARDAAALWAGVFVPVFTVCFLFSTVLNLFDTGGVVLFTDRSMMLAGWSMSSIVQGTQFVSFLLALFAYYSNRSRH